MNNHIWVLVIVALLACKKSTPESRGARPPDQLAERTAAVDDKSKRSGVAVERVARVASGSRAGADPAAASDADDTSFDDEGPGYDDEKPGYDDEEPGYDDEEPGYDDEEPGYDDDEPIEDEPGDEASGE